MNESQSTQEICPGFRRWSTCEGYLGPVLLLGVRVHVREAPQDQGLHEGALHRAGQQVERRAAAGELLGQVPPALALHHDVRPARRPRRSKGQPRRKQRAGAEGAHTHLSLFSTRVTSRSTVSLASSASELHTDRLLITFSSR